jgi:hypothetical protein
MSDTIKANCGGRLANKLFYNLTVSYLAQRYKKSAEYLLEDKFIQLGILFHKDPTPISSDITISISDSNLLAYIDNSNNATYHFTIVNDTYCQLKELSHMFYNHFRLPAVKPSIISANPYKSRYGLNRDVFVHVRLGDVTHLSPGIEYYESALKAITYENGYISTDSPYHPMITTLISKYNLHRILFHEVETIQFGSTCKYLILSQGTFSWLIGALGFESSIQYPAIKHKWHGDIFVIPEWKELDW